MNRRDRWFFVKFIILVIGICSCIAYSIHTKKIFKGSTPTSIEIGKKYTYKQSKDRNPFKKQTVYVCTPISIENDWILYSWYTEGDKSDVHKSTERMSWMKALWVPYKEKPTKNKM